VAERGGAVCVNFNPGFLDDGYRMRRRRVERTHAEEFAAVAASSANGRERARRDLALAQALDPSIGLPTVERLVDHLAHITAIGGDGAACLGSDYDGIGELPAGMADASDLPVLVDAIERRGLPVAKILGENVLRVLAAQGAEGDARFTFQLSQRGIREGKGKK
jgi:membrane dipeptidase